jgi:3-deoxy-D-manno-octulosonic-acid transferase
VDRIGVLFELYGLGDLLFCGGTIEPVGGHNILEPAAWEKAVFYGPHVQKVLTEHNRLQAERGSFLVQNGDDLRRQWEYWIHRLDALERHGKGGANALKSLAGVVDKQVDLIIGALMKSRPR